MLNQVPGVGIEPTSPCGRGILSLVQLQDKATSYDIATPGACRNVSPVVAVGRLVLAPDSATAREIARKFAHEWAGPFRRDLAQRVETLEEWAAREAVPAEEALLPCPFCGGPAELTRQNQNGTYWYDCSVEDCAATLGGVSASPEEARARWNRRAVPAVQP